MDRDGAPPDRVSREVDFVGPVGPCSGGKLNRLIARRGCPGDRASTGGCDQDLHPGTGTLRRVRRQGSDRQKPRRCQRDLRYDLIPVRDDRSGFENTDCEAPRAAVMLEFQEQPVLAPIEMHRNSVTVEDKAV